MLANFRTCRTINTTLNSDLIKFTTYTPRRRRQRRQIYNTVKQNAICQSQPALEFKTEAPAILSNTNSFALRDD